MSEQKRGLSYRDAGVNIDAADEAVRQIKDLVNKTFDDRVLCDIGLFGAMYSPDLKGIEEPVLVSSVDGVGTKLKLAFMTGRHDTIGIDLVSHCVNDILVQGARPLFFLDYLAFGALEPDVVVAVIRGLTSGCRYAGCALIGGETAEMPGMYHEGEYDISGTIVGIVDRKKIVDGSTIQAGDVIIGLRSTGLHTNGYSLARKICFEVAGLTCDDAMPGVGRTVGEVLLEPHKSYATLIRILMKIVNVKGMAHITGGGITDNLPRSLPKSMGAEINLNAWEALPVFRFLQECGHVEDKEMLRTFNMGMGYLIVVGREDEEKALRALHQAGTDGTVIGRVVEGEHRVQYTGSIRYATAE
ncbi:MAG: phosphoribosylformylglycinamidine cyclo-ligase [Candidatus Hydrogenedentes bacterium]|nr:phosphoribosylformylglycinamidine cyclo-ligase [Candidatus Hydrogenedentota bacterium]